MQEECFESAVTTLRREREERKRKLKRAQEKQGNKRLARTVGDENRPQNHRHLHLRTNKYLRSIDRIIPSKVPLDETYNESVPPGKRYSSKQLLDKQRKAGHQVGLILDLTNTTRYYLVQAWTKLGIKHQKIACRGRDAVPDNESVNQFVYAVAEFINRHKNSKDQKYILVHCTHGHNRTGFMMVHYLMRSHLTSVTEALHKFAVSRPPGIYKHEYIQALYEFYHEVPESFVYPSTPEWKRCSHLDPNGDPSQDDDDHLSDSSIVLQENSEYNSITNDDVLGDAIPHHQQEALHSLTYELLGMPGFHEMTLIDGEMVIDKVENVGLKRRYLAYDLMAINGVSKVKLPFSERWKLLKEEIIKPRNYENNPTYRYDMELFRVRRKGFWLLSTVEKLLGGFIPSLSHESDGLIFQGWDDPYVCRTHEGLLKWKYPEMNLVDFLFEIGSRNNQLLFLFERGKKIHMDGECIKFSDEEDISAISGKIVECSKDPIENCWVCMRVRHDKATPNDINTYRKVLRSIKDNITQDVLVSEIKEIVRLPMYED
ncbi:hypothetical protein LUZ60_015463 [Juncus effusus]|nr:hypothetical protein LUZ60_015463 [Juncus effusus]